jgi:hypothetical protein
VSGSLVNFRPLITHDFKVWVVSNFVSMSSHDFFTAPNDGTRCTFGVISLELRLPVSCLFFTFGGIPRVSQLGFWLHYPPCDIYGNEQHRDLEQEQVCRSACSRRVGCQRYVSLTRRVSPPTGGMKL